MDTIAIFLRWVISINGLAAVRLTPIRMPLKQRHRRRGKLCLSEVMTIMVGFHLSGYRTFKHY